MCSVPRTFCAHTNCCSAAASALANSPGRHRSARTAPKQVIKSIMIEKMKQLWLPLYLQPAEASDRALTPDLASAMLQNCMIKISRRMQYRAWLVAYELL